MSFMVIDYTREKYPVFIYRDYSIKRDKDEIILAFNFTIEGLTDFSPEIRIDTSNLTLLNSFDSEIANRIVFALGLVEAVSYFKAVCPETIKVLCGTLSEKQIHWFKKLWYNGLGEFFYINNIDIDFESFIEIEARKETKEPTDEFIKGGLNLIPIGGGKDSCVTLSLLKNQKNLFLTINEQKARTECVKAAGFGKDYIIKVKRDIDKRLLELNKQGFLNGHTPFSAIVAFLSLYCAYITGCENIALSNEASANEGNIKGGDINHQYSKSFQFESDFRDYVSTFIMNGIEYFSLLRPFNELQIAKYFSLEKEYHKAFRSCNKGASKNIWCGKCSKCLFVFGILSPFLTDEKIIQIFSKNLFDDYSLLSEFKGLYGSSPIKPFECVGTAREYLFAISKKTLMLKEKGKRLPFLLDYLDKTENIKSIVKEGEDLLFEFNSQHCVPKRFMFAVEEMKKVAAKSD